MYNTLRGALSAAAASAVSAAARTIDAGCLMGTPSLEVGWPWPRQRQRTLLRTIFVTRVLNDWSCVPRRTSTTVQRLATAATARVFFFTIVVVVCGRALPSVPWRPYSAPHAGDVLIVARRLEANRGRSSRCPSPNCVCSTWSVASPVVRPLRVY